MALDSIADRVLVAYLRANLPTANIYAAFCSEDRTAIGGNISVSCGDWRLTDSGASNPTYGVVISMAYQSAEQSEDAPGAARKALDALCDSVYALLLLTDDDGRTFRAAARLLNAAAAAEAAANPDDSADLANFTCLQWVPTGGGRSFDVEGSIWRKTLTFDMEAAEVGGLLG